MTVDFTADQWAILALVLVLGWLLGLLSRSGGARWRREAELERERRIAAEKDRDARLLAADDRIRELEHGGPAAQPGVVRQDDLTRIRGIDTARATRLNEAGIHGFRDIVNLPAADEPALEDRLDLTRGTIASEGWRDQAAALLDGRRTVQFQP